VHSVLKESIMKSRLLPVFAAAILAISLSACGSMSNRDRDTATGAVIGGVAGSVLTGGSTAGAVGGAVVGGVIGNQVDHDKDRK
jgi:osmotically inducible lipoprotein OsmB